METINNKSLMQQITVVNRVNDSKLLIKFCKDKNLREAKRLLATKFINLEQQDDAGCTAFHYACIHEDKMLLDILLNNYIYPHLMEEYIFHETEHFIGLQNKNENKTILHYIGESDLIEFYNKLELYFPTKIHKSINFVTHNGNTALHLACKNASTKVLDKLIRIPQLNINQINNLQNTALHIACQHNHLAIVKALLLHPQINVNLQNSFGDTPLHTACKSNHYGIIQIVTELLKMRSMDMTLINN